MKKADESKKEKELKLYRKYVDEKDIISVTFCEAREELTRYWKKDGIDSFFYGETKSLWTPFARYSKSEQDLF